MNGKQFERISQAIVEVAELQDAVRRYNHERKVLSETRVDFEDVLRVYCAQQLSRAILDANGVQ